VTEGNDQNVSATEAPSPEPVATAQPAAATEVPASGTEAPSDKKVTGVKVSGIQKNKAKITWNNVSDADSYVVAYSTSKAKLAKQKKASTKAASGVKVKKVSKNAVTLTGLKKKTKYFVKVSAGGDYSTVKSFTTKK
jgi:hypothetical protein